MQDDIFTFNQLSQCRVRSVVGKLRQLRRSGAARLAVKITSGRIADIKVFKMVVLPLCIRVCGLFT